MRCPRIPLGEGAGPGTDLRTGRLHAAGSAAVIVVSMGLAWLDTAAARYGRAAADRRREAGRVASRTSDKWRRTHLEA